MNDRVNTLENYFNNSNVLFKSNVIDLGKGSSVVINGLKPIVVVTDFATTDGRFYTKKLTFDIVGRIPFIILRTHNLWQKVKFMVFIIVLMEVVFGQ